MIKNRIYVNQFYLLAFISIVTFKVGMLPGLMAQIDAKEGIFAVAFMMIIELMMLSIVYASCKNGSFLEMNIPKTFKVIISISVIVSLTIKFLIFFSESAIYIQTNLFENANKLFVILPLMLTLVYIAYNGVNNIARISEILFFVIAFAIIFNILFANIDIEQNPLKDMKITQSSALIIDKYIIWFGDFTPFLFTSITRQKEKRNFPVLAIAGIILIPVILEIGFVCIFKEGGEFIKYAFSKLAVYNQFSFLIGSFDIPTIICFLIVSIIKLALMLFAIIDIFAYLFEKKKLTTIIITVFLFVALFLINSEQVLINFATCGIRYVVLAIEYLAPCAVFVLMKIYKQDNKEMIKIHA